ncbi:hypothetical protein [Arenimonas alkanexedens]
MTQFRNAPVLIALLAVLATSPAQAEALDAITLTHYLPASSQTQAQFTCVGSTTGQPDASIAFETVSSAPGVRASRVKSLSVRGQALSDALLSELNAIVGKDSVTMAIAGCTDQDVRVVVGVYRPGDVPDGGSFEDGNDYLYVYFEGATGKLRLE